MNNRFHTLDLAFAFQRACSSVKARAYVRDQLERASLSIVLNLTEGEAKPTLKDKKRFYAMAYGSIRECQAILRVLGNQPLFEQADKLGAFTWKLLKSA